MLLSLYNDFSETDKAVLAQLPPEQVANILKKVDETNKTMFDQEMKVAEFGLKQ
jgi:hypothetical protein